MAALQQTTATYPNYKIVVTGHSLGGAIATVAAAEIRESGLNVDLYTYGAPRIGHAVVSDFISNQNKGGNYRVTHTNDPIPKLPGRRFGWRHISPEYYIKTGNNVDVTAEDVEVYYGNASDEGNAGTGFSFDPAAHLWYFNGIANCGHRRFDFGEPSVDLDADPEYTA